jgi:hypothetical protein
LSLIQTTTITTTPSTNGTARKLCVYLLAWERAVNAGWPISGIRSQRPNVITSPLSARRMKLVAVSQWTARSKALKRGTVSGERPDSMRIRPR